MSKRQDRQKRQGLDRTNSMARVYRVVQEVVRGRRAGVVLVAAKDAERWNTEEVSPARIAFDGRDYTPGDLVLLLRSVVLHLADQLLQRCEPEQVDDTAQRLRADINVALEGLVESMLAEDETTALPDDGTPVDGGSRPSSRPGREKSANAEDLVARLVMLVLTSAVKAGAERLRIGVVKARSACKIMVSDNNWVDLEPIHESLIGAVMVHLSAMLGITGREGKGQVSLLGRVRVLDAVVGPLEAPGCIEIRFDGGGVGGNREPR